MGCREAVDYGGDCEPEGVELGGLAGFIDGRRRLKWVCVLEEARVEVWGGVFIPGLGVVRDGRGRRLAGIRSILLRLVGGKVRVLWFEERQRLG